MRLTAPWCGADYDYTLMGEDGPELVACYNGPAPKRTAD